jgi:hypothetical protein
MWYRIIWYINAIYGGSWCFCSNCRRLTSVLVFHVTWRHISKDSSVQRCPPREPEIVPRNSEHHGKADLRIYDFYFSVGLREGRPTASDIMYSETSNIVIYIYKYIYLYVNILIYNFYDCLTMHLELYSHNEPTRCTIFYCISLPHLYMFRAIFSPSAGGQLYNVAMVLLLLLKRLSAGLVGKDSRFKSKSNTIATLYTWPPADGLKIARNM